MAWSNAALTTNETNGFNGDKPLLISANAAESTDTGTNGLSWKTGGLWSSGADATATNFDGFYSIDLSQQYPTQPSSAQTTWYFLLRGTSAGANALPNFDNAEILGHNFNGQGITSVTLQIADSDDFATRLQTIQTWSTFNTKRLVSLNLNVGGAAQRFSGVTRARLAIVAGGAITPQIGELILGQRRQLLHQPTRPWGPNDVRSQYSDWVSASGATARVTDFVGQADFQATWVMGNSQEISDVQSFITESNYGARPFLFIPNPNTAPGVAYYCKIKGDTIRLPNVEGSLDRTWKLNFQEDAPFYATE